MMTDDDLDAAWHHAEQLQYQYESELRERHPEWFLHRREQVKTSQMIQSKYLKKDDFPSPEVLTIKDCSLEEVGKGDTRWVLFFKEKTKGVVLNVTKIRQLEAAYGDDTDGWIGKKVKLSHDPTVMMGTQQVGGIKMTLPNGAVKAPPPKVERPDEDFEDEIPF